MKFELQSQFTPTGDQPSAISALVSGLQKEFRDQTLLGVTGSGKTFTMANVIAEIQRPTLIISHNKTLAAQLASEFREFFPKNAVHYFVSYYDYYQPESYIPRTDTFIEKETEINEEIDRLRHASTQSLLSRRDVIIVASVSCIYGLGSPVEYKSRALTLKKGQEVGRQDLMLTLTQMQFNRNDMDFARGTYRVRGDIVDVFPKDAENRAFRIHLFGDEIEKIEEIDAFLGDAIAELPEVDIYPATYYSTAIDNLEDILNQIRSDLKTQLAVFEKQGKLLEAQRLKQRTEYDIEMMQNTGFVSGIENYSRYFDGRKPGTPPYTLIDFFPDDFLIFIDESHITVPQIGGMSGGDRSRKDNLVNFGFRLPAARDNRPLTYPEFDKKIGQAIYVSATPKEYELKVSKNVAEQLIRPTGLLDPEIELRPTTHQVDNLLEEVRVRVKNSQRVLVTTLTKRMAEELSEYMEDAGVKVHYLHSEIDTFERIEILRDLRLGVYDVVVGINLLREGLDLPEVSLVAILDADKEGFLRSDTSLIQTIGRAARHQDGKVIMYADTVTGSMKAAMLETERRRKKQMAYNTKHGITPTTIQKKIRDDRIGGGKDRADKAAQTEYSRLSALERKKYLDEVEAQMELASRNLEFEHAAELRDLIMELKKNQRNKRKRV